MKINLIGTAQSICRRFSGALKALVIGSVIAFTGASQAYVESEVVNGLRWYFEVVDGSTAIYKADHTPAVEAVSGSLPLSITVPTTLGGGTVWRLGNGTFWNLQVTNVVLPSSLTSIADYAFYQCTKLSKVNIPSGVTDIGKHAFQFCYSLPSVSLPSSLTEIGEYAFAHCTKIPSVTVPSGVTAINQYTFWNCTNLTTVTLPYGVTSIGNYAFKDCTKLAEANIPVLFLDRNLNTAFEGTPSTLVKCFCGSEADSNSRTWYYRIKNVKIGSTEYMPVEVRKVGASSEAAVSSAPDGGVLKVPGYYKGYSVREIGSMAFRNRNMAQIEYPSTVTNFASSAFEYAYGLKYFTISNSVTGIGTYAFYYCTNLESVAFAATSKVPKIGAYTFTRCKFSKISLPDSVTSIANNAFYNCANLIKADVPGALDGKITKTSAFVNPASSFKLVFREKVGSVTWYYTVDASGNAWIQNGDGSTDLDRAVSPTSVTSLTVPSTLGGHPVTTIGAYALNNLTSLTSVTIPSGVTMVGAYAFAGCTKLTTVNMPDTLVAIGVGAFNQCTSLKKVTIPDNVTAIGNSAFANCSQLASAIVPSRFKGNSSVSTSDVFKNSASSFAITYSATATIDGRTMRVMLDGTKAKIGDGTNPAIISGSTSGSLTIPSSITVSSTSYTVSEISDQALKNTGITSLSIPATITRIGNTAFYGCSSLSSVTIPSNSGLTTLGAQAFAYCTSLAQISLPRALTSLGQWAFDGCKKLGYATFNSPDSGTGLTTIPQYAFRDCTNLTTVTLPYEVTTINANAFEGCTKLKTAYLPMSFYSSFSTLKSSTFPDCPSTLAFKFCGKATSSSKTWYYVVHRNASYSSLELTKIGSYSTPAVYPKPTSSSSSVTVPYQLDTGYGIFTVKGLGQYAFYGCSEMTSIEIAGSSTVTNIGYAAFQDCGKLTSFTMPNAVAGLGTYAFYNCSNMTSVALSTALKKIPGYAFYKCSKLTEVNVPDSVNDISANAFKDCSKLKKAYLPLTLFDTIRTSLTAKEIHIFSGCAADMFLYYQGRTSYPNEEVYGQIYNGTHTWYGEVLADNNMHLANVAYPVNPQPTGSVTIPQSICGSLVRGLGYGLRYLTGVTEVFVPAYVTSLGESVFDGCTGLTKVSYGNGANVTNVARRAFYGCTALKSSESNPIPSGAKAIGDSAFENCKALTAATIPSGCKTIGWSAFAGCTGLTSATIPATVTGIDGKAFYNCSNLATLTLPGNTGSLTTIGTQAFYNCTKLPATLRIPYSVTSIGDAAFEKCTSLSTVYLSASLYGINEKAKFKDCSSSLKIYYEGTYNDGSRVWLYRVVGPNAIEVTGVQNNVTSGSFSIPSKLGSYSIVSIGNSAFQGGLMTSLSILPSSSVTNIGASAFASCTSLASVTIPDVVKKLGSEAFRNCTSLASASLPGAMLGKVDESDVFYGTPALTNKKITYRMGTIGGAERFAQVLDGYTFYYKIVSGKAVLEHGDTLTPAVSPKPGTSFTVPSTLGGYTVGGIGYAAFYGCSALRSLTIPTSVTSFGDYAFAGTDLTAVPLGMVNVTRIGAYAFDGCSSLPSVRIDDIVTSIGNYAFRNCTHLELASLPYALKGALGAQTFEGCPANLCETYRYNSTTYCDYVNGRYWYYNIVSGGAQLYKGAKAPCVEPAPSGALTIPATLGGKPVTIIGGDAFYGCTGLTGVTMPNTVTSFASSAFYGSGLEAMEIPDTVTSIGPSAFQGCASLESVTIPSSVTTLGNYAFYNCDSLAEVTIPGSIKVIGDHAFHDCDGLETVVMGEGVESIGAHSFEHCDILREVTIPSTVTFIGQDAFKDCPLLEKINVPTGKKDAIVALLVASGLTNAASLVQEPDPGKWQISFDADGGTCNPLSMQVTKGQALGTLPTASKSGFSLVGWFTAKTGGTQITKDTKPDGDKTYYARWSQITYEVTFDANGGTPATTKKTYAANATLGSLGLPEVTYAAHNFAGWFTAKSGGTQVTAATTVTKAITYYAHWTDVPKHTITFNANGGQCATASIQVLHGSTPGSALPSATRTGYDFQGWKDAGGNAVTSTTVVNGDLACTAQWTAKHFTVTFDANGGSPATTEKTVDYDTVYGTLPTPILVGSDFKGWFTAKSGGSQILETTVFKQTANQTLYARWETAAPPVADEHTVTLNPGAADATVSPTSIKVEHGKAIGTLPDPERTGYSFLRWTVMGVEVQPSMTVTEDIVCTAQWQANEYTVEFDAQEGSVSPESKTVTFDSAYGTLPTPNRTGFSFKGWFTEVMGGGVQVTAATIVTKTEDHTLYAYWEVVETGYCSVTFDANGGTCSETSRQVAEGAKIGTFPTVSPRTGYDFMGWKDSFGNDVDANTVVTEDITCVAQWQAKSYTVQFDAQGGSVTPTSKSVTYDSPYGALPEPVKAENTFAGWYTAFNGGEKITAATVVKITATQTLYAHWLSDKATAWTDTSTTPHTTWYYRLTPEGDGVELFNAGECAVDPEPNGALVIPNTIAGYPVKAIGYMAFRNCKNLTGVTIPFSVTAIGDYAFAFSGLDDWLQIPSLVKTIGQAAFYECKNLDYVTIGSGVEEMGLSAFQGCTSLKAVAYADGCPLKTIPANAFWGCTSLPSASFPPTAEEIGESAYNGCSSLTSAYILKNIQQIGTGAFADTALNTVYVSPMDEARVRQMLEDSGLDLTGITFEVLELPFDFPAGKFVKVPLEELGFASYKPAVPGTPYTVAALGLPSGLKLKYNAAVKDKKGKVTKKAKVDWWIEGVPTSALDYATQPAYLTITADGEKTTVQFSISVTAQKPTDLNDPSLWDEVSIGQSFTADEPTYLPDVGKGWTVSGLPTGLKFATKKITKKSGKKTVTVAEAYTVYGKTTKAGLFNITAKKKNGAYYETLKFKVLVTPKYVDSYYFGSLSDKKSVAHEDYVEWYLEDDVASDGVKVTKVAGLPTGLKFAAKNTYAYTNPKKKTGKYLDQEAQTIVGTPTKAGTFVVTFTKNVKVGKTTKAKTAQILWTVTASSKKPEPNFNPGEADIEDVSLGVKYADLLTFSAAKGSTVTATGLPKGMSLKKNEDGTWSIVGNTTKSGVFLVTVKAVLNGNTVTQRRAIRVNALPAWAKGTFPGHFVDSDSNVAGMGSLTVSSVGKISGKFVDKGKTWTYSASCFTMFDGASYSAPVTAKYSYKVKNGKKTVTKTDTRKFTLTVYEGSYGGEVNLVEDGGTAFFEGFQNLWTSKYKQVGRALFYTSSKKPYKTTTETWDVAGKPCTLSLKITSTGAVTATLTFDTGKKSKGKVVYYKPTCSTVVKPMSDADPNTFTGHIQLYFAPSAGNNFPGWSEVITVSP